MSANALPKSRATRPEESSPVEVMFQRQTKLIG
uniref:Uncharacterized protein n=1 Tax=Anguilla anguilla TaxID=7936 RepID=A0A0E9PUQ3_ANGAN